MGVWRNPEMTRKANDDGLFMSVSVICLATTDNDRRSNGYTPAGPTFLTVAESKTQTSPIVNPEIPGSRIRYRELSVVSPVITHLSAGAESRRTHERRAK